MSTMSNSCVEYFFNNFLQNNKEYLIVISEKNGPEWCGHTEQGLTTTNLTGGITMAKKCLSIPLSDSQGSFVDNNEITVINLSDGVEYLKSLQEKVYVFGELVADQIIRTSGGSMADAHANLVQDTFDGIQKDFNYVMDSFKTAMEAAENNQIKLV